MVEYPFHLAVQVRDITEAREFYGRLLGCTEGRSAAGWVDFNLYGHQLVAHLNPRIGPTGHVQHTTNGVADRNVPVPHFGVVLSLSEWDALRAKVEHRLENFVMPPQIRFAGEAGEQRTMFFLDPSGNALEFKAFADLEEGLFAK